jgi:hypothetical protein
MTHKGRQKIWVAVTIALYISLPIIVYGVANKLYFEYWFIRKPSLKRLHQITNIVSLAVQVEIKGHDKEFRYRFWDSVDPHKSLASTLRMHRKYFDSPAYLLDRLDTLNLSPQDAPIMTEETLQYVSQLFRKHSPRLRQEAEPMRDFDRINGEVYALQDTHGNLLYAWELSSQVKNDHFLHEIIFFQGGTIIESYFFYNDIAGNEAMPLGWGIVVWFGETLILVLIAVSVAIIKISRKPRRQRKNAPARV